VSHSRFPASTWAIALSQIGPSHVRAGKPCQDASAVWSSNVAGRSCLIAAVADGHGDHRHDQSQHGSRLAVQAAITDLIELRQSVERDAASRLWQTAIIPDGQSQTGIIERYGTTLLVAFAFNGTAVIGQLGDGVVGVVDEDGSVELPLAGDLMEVGSVTDSLCGDEAHLRWRTASVDVRYGRTLVLATDGVTNAFPDDCQLTRFLSSVKSLSAEHGSSALNAWLPEWLDRYAAASGDDVSLAILTLASMSSAERPAVPVSGMNAVSTFTEAQVVGESADVFEAGPAVDGGGDGDASDGEKETR